MAKKGGKLRTVYGVFFALLTLFVGGLFIMQTWSIFRSASESPYTVENISKHFKEISLAVWVWLGGLVVNILLALLFPSEKKRVKAAVNEKKSLEKIKAKVPTEGEAFEKAYALSKRKRGFRVFVSVVTTLFAAAAFVLCALTLLGIYYRPLIDKPFFTKQNGAVDKIVQVAVLSIAALLLVSLAAAVLSKSRKREQKGYVTIIAESKKPVVEEVEQTPAPTLEEALPSAAEEAETPLPPVAEENSAVEAIEPVGKKKASPWAAVIRKIVGMLFLEEKHTQEEIDKDILQVIKGLEEEKQGVQASVTAPEETPAPVEEKDEPKKAKKEKVKKEKVKKEKPSKPKKPLVKEKKEKKPRKKGKKAGVITLRVLLAAVGVALVVLGIFNGGMKDVLLKAINICTQCIGLG